MTLNNIMEKSKLFFDTAPIIYFIQAHDIFGSIVRDIFKKAEDQRSEICSSVITITEVLPRPVALGNEILVKQFLTFFEDPGFIALYNIDKDIAELAGKLRGKYSSIKTMDALQLACAIHSGCDLFITNDKQLKKVDDIDVLVLADLVS